MALEGNPSAKEIDLEKQDKIIRANRAPTSADKGMLWIQQTDNSDTTIKLFIRHTRSGVWRSASFT